MKSQPKCPYGPQQLIPFESDLIDGIMGFEMKESIRVRYKKNDRYDTVTNYYLAVPYTYVIDGVEHVLDVDDYRYANDEYELAEIYGHEYEYVEPECPEWKPMLEDDPVPTEAELLTCKESWVTNVLIPERIIHEVVKAIRFARSQGWRDHYAFEDVEAPQEFIDLDGEEGCSDTHNWFTGWGDDEEERPWTQAEREERWKDYREKLRAAREPLPEPQPETVSMVWQ